jgi:hypothetical protein
MNRTEKPLESAGAGRAIAGPRSGQDHIMKWIMRSVMALGLVTLLTACPQTKEQKGLSETLQQYETIVRWAQWDAAADFLSPQYLQEHPITRLDLDRLRLFKVTQYLVRSSTPSADGK